LFQKVLVKLATVLINNAVAIEIRSILSYKLKVESHGRANNVIFSQKDGLSYYFACGEIEEPRTKIQEPNKFQRRIKFKTIPYLSSKWVVLLL